MSEVEENIVIIIVFLIFKEIKAFALNILLTTIFVLFLMNWYSNGNLEAL